MDHIINRPEIRQIIRMLARESYFARQRYYPNLPADAYIIMVQILTHPEGMNISSMARELRVSRDIIRSRVNALEERGLVQSDWDESRVVTLTDEGRQTATDVGSEVATVLVQAFSDILDTGLFDTEDSVIRLCERLEVAGKITKNW